MSLPRIERRDGRPRLLVDDQPFLILGLQWDCDSCFSKQEMNPLFPHAARMEANTAALPVYWGEVEPAPGEYDFTMVDERLAQARQHDLRLVLLWFATWKNASDFYAPDWIRNQLEVYRPAVDCEGTALVSLCPTCEATWARDRDALLALMVHLRDVDHDHRVILFQIENEPGILRSDRCYCPKCNERFAAGSWEAEWGEHAAEAFSIASIASYIDRLAAEMRHVHPIPFYANVWLSPLVGGVPGFDYPSGGAVPAMLDLFRCHAPHLDAISPDIYKSSYREFHCLSEIYSAGGQPFYVAEHSSSPVGRAERNVFYAIGQYGAIGFDPWAIDSPWPQRDAPPLVDGVGGEWGPQAYWLRDSYRVINRAMAPIVDAQGTHRLFTFVQEPAEESIRWAANGCDVVVDYLAVDGMGRGMVIQLDTNEFLVLGLDVSLTFRRHRPDGRIRKIQRVESGRYEGDTWICLRPVRRERPEAEGTPLILVEPLIYRVWLEEE